MKHWILSLFLLAALVLALVGEARRDDPDRRLSGPEPRVARVIPGGIWHRVLPGEDLRSIARRYYGSPRSWGTLARANDLGTDPDPGCLLWVPAERPALPEP